MRSASTRFLCTFVLAAAGLVVALAASSCGVERCTSCFFNFCLTCEPGYYSKGSSCTPCETANCAQCTIMGRCHACKPGYELKYIVTGSPFAFFSASGECVAASAPPTCTDARCTSCIGGVCIACEDRFYARGSVCTACPTANCSKCPVFGHCIQCAPGFNLTYASAAPGGMEVDIYGNCKPSAKLIERHQLTRTAAVTRRPPSP